LRIFSGKGDSLMALVLNSARVGFIVTAAISMGAAGSAVYDTVGVRLPGVITGYITDSSNTVEQQIDNSLFAMTVAMKTIDALEVVSDPTIEDDKNRALYMIAVGTAGPAVTAGALLLFYQAALALFVGLGPIFILCLMFDQTKDLFRRWLMYGIGTMFSMAVLAAMTSISLKAVIAVAAANFSTALASNLLGMNLSSGITSASMQQGGIGLLLTLLIVTVPPMAAGFFQGTLGSFAFQSQVAGGGAGFSKQSLSNNTGGSGAQQAPQPNQQMSSTGQNSNAPNQPSALSPSSAVTNPRNSTSSDTSTGRMGVANPSQSPTPPSQGMTSSTAPNSNRTDSATGRQIDPATGHHIDPATGRRHDPVSGRPIG
jgi:type IV secretion system protein VirB6